MPILRNAKKALRVSARKTIINARVKSRVKTITGVYKKSPTSETLASAFSAIDKAVKQNLFHINKGSRLKSQLSRLLS